MNTLRKIISGGQAGVDRAALDVALEMDIPCGGWCPRQREAEDGRIDSYYPLEETDSIDPAIRTRKNIELSDGTLIIHINQILDKGTRITLKLCEQIGKPVLLIDMANSKLNTIFIVREWIAHNEISILNVAGCRESNCPGIYNESYRIISDLLH
jgi:hypothetical protein